MAQTIAARLTMGIRLLLVDDDPGFRETLRDLLAQRKEAVILAEAENGEEALRLADAPTDRR